MIVLSTASILKVFCFFFSSRRRHTRYWRDWSSDVCSSDLSSLARSGPSLGTGPERSSRMRDVLDDLIGWWQAGETVGMGTVVATWRSAPRPAGASMLVGPDGTAVGSVSGGCVEGAVYEEARDVVESGVPTLERYGVSDDDAFAVGLTCGGILDVFVGAVSRESFPELGEVAESVARHEPVAVVTCVAGPEDRVGRRLVVWPDRSSGTLGLQRLDDAVADDARGMLAAGRTGMLHVGHDGERRGDDLSLFVNAFAPAARMVVFGAIDFADRKS